MCVCAACVLCGARFHSDANIWILEPDLVNSISLQEWRSSAVFTNMYQVFNCEKGCGTLLHFLGRGLNGSVMFSQQIKYIETAPYLPVSTECSGNCDLNMITETQKKFIMAKVRTRSELGPPLFSTGWQAESNLSFLTSNLTKQLSTNRPLKQPMASSTLEMLSNNRLSKTWARKPKPVLRCTYDLLRSQNKLYKS